ncbi:MAG: hypothetical protein ACR2OD_04905 [Gaiellaceae bacterium]
MRPIERIKNEITELTERRTAMWGELGRGGAADNAAVAELTTRIDELWDELRATRVVSAYGLPDEIKRRADRERRMEIELNRAAVGLEAQAA